MSAITGSPESHKTAHVNGGSIGIGWALASEIARHGHDLVLEACDIQRLDQLSVELQQLYRIRALIIPSDLSEPAAVPEIVQEIQQDSLKIGLLRDNAGVDLFG